VKQFTITKIKLQNFACYKGNQEMDFRDESGKNLFVFNLRNGYGKTSLYHSIRWVFYGEEVEYYKDGDRISTKDFINSDVDKDESICSVSAWFTFDDSEYLVERKLIPSSGESVLSLTKDGMLLNHEGSKGELDHIVPMHYADFFMFDGERLSHFVSKQKELYMEDSVLQLLGLKQLKTLKEDLKSLNKKYDNEIKSFESKSKDVKRIQAVINGLDEELENKDLEMNNKTSENQDFQEKLDKAKKAREDYEALPDIMTDLTKKKVDKQKKESEISRLLDKLVENRKNLYLVILKEDLRERVDSIDERLAELENVAEMTDRKSMVYSLVDDILEFDRENCPVCENKLGGGSYADLKEKRSNLEENYRKYDRNRNEISELRMERTVYKNALDQTGFDFQYHTDKVASLRDEISELDTEIKKLEKESTKSIYGDISKINQTISDLEGDIRDNENKMDILNRQKTAIEAQKKEKQRELKAVGHCDDMLNKLLATNEYISNLIEKLKDAIEEGTRYKRDGILEHSNRVFLKMTNKPEEYKGLRFENEESFAYVIERFDERIVMNPSKGEKQIMAMCFLIGLSQFTERNNPIVMDTPVSSFDDIHGVNFGEALAELENQVFFLAQPKELMGPIYDRMAPCISKQFEADRMENYTVIREGNAKGVE